MPRKIEPNLHTYVLGVSLDGDDRSAMLELLQWIKQFGLIPTAHIGATTTTDDPELIVKEYYSEYKPDPEFPKAKHNSDSNFICSLRVPWNIPDATHVDLDIDSWENRTKLTVHISVTTRPSAMSRTDISAYDPIAEGIADFSLALHQRLEAKLTVSEGWGGRIPTPYNEKTAPLWVGWYSIYGKELQAKYGLKDSFPPPSIVREERGDDLMFYSTRLLSEHLLNGWSPDDVKFWQKIGGRLLRKPKTKSNL